MPPQTTGVLGSSQRILRVSSRAIWCRLEMNPRPIRSTFFWDRISRASARSSSEGISSRLLTQSRRKTSVVWNPARRKAVER